MGDVEEEIRREEEAHDKRVLKAAVKKFKEAREEWENGGGGIEQKQPQQQYPYGAGPVDSGAKPQRESLGGIEFSAKKIGSVASMLAHAMDSSQSQSQSAPYIVPITAPPRAPVGGVRVCVRVWTCASLLNLWLRIF